MTKLMSFLRPYRAAAILAPLFMIVEVCMDLLQPTFMAGIVNEGVTAGSLDAVWRYGGWMIAAAAVGLIGGVGCTYFSTVASQGFGTDLRNRMFRRVQTFTFRNLDQLTTGSLVTRLTADIVQLQNLVMTSLRILVRDFFLFAGSLTMAFLINPRLALLCLAIMPLLIAILYATLRRSAPLFRQVQEKLDRVNTVVQENLSGIRVVKAFVRAAFERARFGRANRDNRDMAIRAARAVAANVPLLTLILNAGIVAILWFGGHLAGTGGLEVGSLAAFITYVSQMAFAMAALGNLIVTISRARASAVRVREVLDTVPDMQEPPAGATTGAAEGEIRAERIAFEDVSFGYGGDGDGDALVLRGVNLTIEPGQTVGILGATGSGKSTLVSLIPRLYDPGRGRITIGGVDAKDIPSAQLRRQVGMVLQQAVLYSGTIRDNIRYGKPDATQEEVEAAARAAEAHGFISGFPEGYDTIVGQKGVNLSGGQKQRISIARAILLNPGILVLDDSTSAVDLGTESRIQTALRERMQSSTRLVIAQRISSVIDADKIVVLDDGQIAAEGTHDELLARSPVYREIYQSQREKEALYHV
ncbi:ABC transporter ATP-binding protein [Cohnella sp. REN36]|uniref:ABC transporter ATP-binding protein n=1 Tax=Cohnella sp. REN36 TaxID=2887347 RepID=UPI001D141271|nr:ABC transporter ATP-binding protein [Cohnella sp. REN36]MCC3375104.1 ABC transporter ATP-binding protein/permease [Cohnella sp. REN36]